jgi:hypothetical protein
MGGENMGKRLFILSLLLFIVTIFGAFKAEGAMISYWKLDEGAGFIAKDSVDNNSGFIVGAEWVKGISKKALKFDGDAYVSISDSPSFTISDSITVEAWVKPSAYMVPEKGFVHWSYTIVSKEWWPDQEWTLYVNKDTHALGAYIVTSDKEFHIVEDVVELSPDVWHHVAFTYDGVELRLYRDGQLVNRIAVNGNISDTNTRIHIGMSPGTPEYLYNPWIGVIDEVAIWDEALSPCEIYRHYYNGLDFGIGYNK